MSARISLPIDISGKYGTPFRGVEAPFWGYRRVFGSAFRSRAPAPTPRSDRLRHAAHHADVGRVAGGGHRAPRAPLPPRYRGAKTVIQDINLQTTPYTTSETPRKATYTVPDQTQTHKTATAGT